MAADLLGVGVGVIEGTALELGRRRQVAFDRTLPRAELARDLCVASPQPLLSEQLGE